MTGHDLRSWRRLIDVPQWQLAQRLEVARQTISTWEQYKDKRLPVRTAEAIEAVQHKIAERSETTGDWKRWA